MEQIDNVFDFLRKAEGLKSTLRYGKSTNGRQESAAEHSWRVALMTFILAKELAIEIDLTHALQMAIVHDIAESLIGDIDFVRVSDGEITRSEKHEIERKALMELKDSLPGRTGEEIYSLWKEYEAGTTDIARYVKAIDKLETLTQLMETGHMIYDRPELIANYADDAVDVFPVLKPFLRILKGRLREEFRKGSIEWKQEYDV